MYLQGCPTFTASGDNAPDLLKRSFAAIQQVSLGWLNTFSFLLHHCQLFVDHLIFVIFVCVGRVVMEILDDARSTAS